MQLRRHRRLAFSIVNTSWRSLEAGRLRSACGRWQSARACATSSMSTDLTLGTHNGTFHCDEALACFMLRQLPSFRKATVVRSRDLDELSKLDCIVDVGGVYDVGKMRFDHHQRGFFETLDERHKTKLSSAGLVYKHFGREVIQEILETKLSEKDLRDVFIKVYDSFVEEVDGNDNGVSRFDTDAPQLYECNSTLPARVGRLNPPWTEASPDFDKNFPLAMELTGSEFKQTVLATAQEWLPGRALVLEAMSSRFEVDPSGEIMQLKQFCPWKSHLHALEEAERIPVPIKYVLYEDTSGKWRVQCVSKTPSSFESRKPLPTSWRGLNNEQLSEVTGIPNCVFVHNSGFIGGNETQAGVLEMARQSLAYRETKVHKDDE